MNVVVYLKLKSGGDNLPFNKDLTPAQISGKPDLIIQ